MTSIRNLKSRLVLGAAAAVLSAAVAAPTASAQGAGNEEVVVTAQRRAQAVQRVPVTITALTAKQLELRQISDTLQVIKAVPNMIGGNNTGLGSTNAYFMRGLGSTESHPAFDPPVGTYVDDVYLPRQNSNNYGLLDVERIEVLRGPQGTLFGRNTTGGAINVITRNPDPTEQSGMVELFGGEFSRIGARGVVNVPLSETAAVRFAGYYFQDDGYLDSAVFPGERLNDKEQYALRGKARFMAGPDVTIDLSAEYIYDNGINAPSLRTNAVTGDGDPNRTNALLRESNCSGDIATLATAAGGRFGSCNINKSWAVGAKVNWRVSEALAVESITGYRHINQVYSLDFAAGGLGPSVFAITNDGDHAAFSQELKLNGSFGDNFDFVAGLYYLSETNDVLFADIGTGISIERLMDVDLSSLAFYAQGDYHVTDKLTVTAGLRWTTEERKIRFANTGRGASGFTTADMIAAGVPVDQEVDKFTPKFGVQYQVRENLMLFASATNGFKSGGWNIRSATSPATASRNNIFNPEKAWSYEAGMKSEWFDRNLRFNATFFKMNVTDLQVITGIPGVPGVFITQNAGDMTIDGLEIDGAFRYENLDVFFSAGWQGAEYTRIVDPSGRITLATKPVRTPNFTGALGATYRIPVESWDGDVVLSVAVNHINKHWVTTTNVPSGSQNPGTTFLDAGVAVNFLGDDWTAAIECRNCTDERIMTAYLFVPYYNEPGRWGARVTRRF